MKIPVILLLIIVLSSFNIFALSQESNIDYKKEMVNFVEKISQKSKENNPDFAIFSQNALELVDYPNYVNSITGISQESIYYGDKIDGRQTQNSITKYLESNLYKFKLKNKIILTLDYPFLNKNKPRFDTTTLKKIDKVYKSSLSKGYIPYTSVRNLNYLTINKNHKPELNKNIKDFSQIKEWVIQLQPAKNQNRTNFLKSLSNSGFDLIVIDYSFDGTKNTEFSKDEILLLKKNLNGKVIAYISIGEAEDYRWYWKKEFEKNKPLWLDKENNKWPGNYKVKYWNKEWQEFIFNYIEKIQAQGFDGVFLDLVDSYEYFENN